MSEAVDEIWLQEFGDGPLVAVALHDGTALRPEVARHIGLSESDRVREEDPHTRRWVTVAPTRVIGQRSRFEVDLNRPRDKAVYRTPADAWGLEIWREDPPEDVHQRSLAEYDAFYTAMRRLFGAVEKRHGRFFVYDIHSYNHRRDGPDRPPASEMENPQVNIGTGSLDRARWGSLADRFIADLSAYDFPGGGLDVRENVRFRGGFFSQWAHKTFPTSACVLAIEFKKFFMDEWTGVPDEDVIQAIEGALHATVPGVLDELSRR